MVTSLERVLAAAASVTDPEPPPLTIDDLGMLRDFGSAACNTSAFND